MLKVLQISSFLNRRLPIVFSALVVTGALYAAQPAVAKTVENNKGANTELMSKPASEGIRAMTSPQIQQVPTEHSKQLHNNIIKLAKNKEEINDINVFENEVYSKFGSYAGAAIVQHAIILNAIETFLNKDIETIKKVNAEFGNEFVTWPQYFGTAPEHSAEIIDYVGKIYNNILYIFEQFNHKPTKEETTKELYEAYREMGLDERTIKAAKMDADATKQVTLQETIDNVASTAHFLYSQAIQNSYCKYIGEIYQGGVGKWLNGFCPDTQFIGFK